MLCLLTREKLKILGLLNICPILHYINIEEMSIYIYVYIYIKEIYILYLYIYIKKMFIYIYKH